MALTSKERAELRGKAHHLNTIFHIGKEGVTPEFVIGVRDALEARELIKIDINQNCDLDVDEAAEIVASRTGSEIVQTIGRKIVIYRKSKNKK